MIHIKIQYLNLMKRILFLLFLPLQLSAQLLPDSVTKKIDEIFRTFNQTTPGCAVAIVKDQQLVFSKGYGMANLEYGAPVKPITKFHIASVSKQYTAFCMLLLEKDGLINLDEDVRKYLDFVPDFGKKITIRHLINHTSGLRDQWQLLAHAGWQLDDVIKQEHVIKLISMQKALNFDPGEEYMYCNTGYTLMAEIVEKVAGLSFRQYTNQKIFKPLGMDSTHFNDNYQEILQNKAYSYSARNGGGFQHEVLSYSTVGPTSLITTVEDHVKWINNFETGKVGGKDLMKKMFETGTLNDGRKLDYAYALVVDTYKGNRQVSHFGADAGFRTVSSMYPDAKLGIVIFSNHAFANLSVYYKKIADLFLADIQSGIEPQKSASDNKTDTGLLKKLEGNYFSHNGERLFLKFIGGKCYLANNAAARGNPIEIITNEKNKLLLPELKQEWLVTDVNLKADSIQSLIVRKTTGSTTFYRQPLPKQTDNKEFVGRFYNEECESFYTVVIKDGRLWLENKKYPSVELRVLAPDQYNTGLWWISHIRFLRDKKNQVTAFEVNAGRVQHLLYKKLKREIE
jgi:CubicO group peptidase (beta-lactamase class C family)